MDTVSDTCHGAGHYLFQSGVHHFYDVENTNVVAFILKDNANGDSWKNIIVALNSRAEPVKLDIPSGKYTVTVSYTHLFQTTLQYYFKY